MASEGVECGDHLMGRDRTLTNHWGYGALLIRVAVIANERIVRLGIRGTVENGGGVYVVGESTTGQELGLVRQTRPDLLVVAVSNGTDAMGALNRLRLERTYPKLLFILDDLAHNSARRLMYRQVTGILALKTAEHHLPWAVHAVARGGLALDPDLGKLVAEHYTHAVMLSEEQSQARSLVCKLGPRAQQVLMLVGQGRSNPEVASLLGITLETVKSHLKCIYSTLNVSSRFDARQIALRAGLTLTLASEGSGRLRRHPVPGAAVLTDRYGSERSSA